MKLNKLLAMMFVAGGLLVGCQNANEEPVVEEAETKEEVDAGEDVVVEEVRVVTATVSAANVLGELNAEVIGIPTTQNPIPDQFLGLPEVGIAHSPDLEVVASLEPDLFIIDANFREANEATLEELGNNTFFFESGTYEAFVDSIASIGAAINREAEAATLINTLESSIDTAIENKTDESPSVAIIFGGGDSFMLATENSYVGGLARIMGATNVASELEGGMQAPFLQFSLEQILVQNPDYILRFAHGNIEQTEEMFNQMFDENPAFQQLSAVQNGNVIDLDFSIFGTVANLRAPEAFERLGEIFYGNN